MKLTAIWTHGNHLFLIEAPLKTIPYFATLSKTGPYLASRSNKFVSNFLNSFLISIFCEPFQSSPFYCLPNFAICILKSSPNFVICILKSSPNFTVLTKLFSLFFAAYLEYFWGIFKPLQVWPTYLQHFGINWWFSGPLGLIIK